MASSTFEEFYSFCELTLQGENPKFLQLIKNRYDECDDQFRESDSMEDLLKETRCKMDEEKSRLFVHLKHFLTLLKSKRNRKKGSSHARKKERDVDGRHCDNISDRMIKECYVLLENIEQKILDMCSFRLREDEDEIPYTPRPSRPSVLHSCFVGDGLVESSEAITVAGGDKLEMLWREMKAEESVDVKVEIGSVWKMFLRGMTVDDVRSKIGPDWKNSLDLSDSNSLSGGSYQTSGDISDSVCYDDDDEEDQRSKTMSPADNFEFFKSEIVSSPCLTPPQELSNTHHDSNQTPHLHLHSTEMIDNTPDNSSQATSQNRRPAWERMNSPRKRVVIEECLGADSIILSCNSTEHLSFDSPKQESDKHKFYSSDRCNSPADKVIVNKSKKVKPKNGNSVREAFKYNDSCNIDRNFKLRNIELIGDEIFQFNDDGVGDSSNNVKCISPDSIDSDDLILDANASTYEKTLTHFQDSNCSTYEKSKIQLQSSVPHSNISNSLVSPNKSFPKAPVFKADNDHLKDSSKDNGDIIKEETKEKETLKVERCDDKNDDNSYSSSCSFEKHTDKSSCLLPFLSATENRKMTVVAAEVEKADKEGGKEDAIVVVTKTSTDSNKTTAIITPDDDSSHSSSNSKRIDVIAEETTTIDTQPIDSNPTVNESESKTKSSKLVNIDSISCTDQSKTIDSNEDLLKKSDSLEDVMVISSPPQTLSPVNCVDDDSVKCSSSLLPLDDAPALSYNIVRNDLGDDKDVKNKAKDVNNSPERESDKKSSALSEQSYGDDKKESPSCEKDKPRRVQFTSLIKQSEESGDSSQSKNKSSFMSFLSLQSQDDTKKSSVDVERKNKDKGKDMDSSHHHSSSSKGGSSKSTSKSKEKSGSSSEDDFDMEKSKPPSSLSDKVLSKEDRHVKRLEETLEKLRDEIEKCQTKEMTLDDLEACDSSYVYEDLLKKKFVKCWDKLCSLTKRTVTTGRPTERTIRYSGTRYKEINRRLEKFLNKRKVFPDFHDVKTIVRLSDKKYKLHLNPNKIDEIAREAFVDIGNMLQKRRHEDFIATFESGSEKIYQQGPDPALFDKELRQKLNDNRKVAKSNLDHVIEKFTQLQHAKANGEEEDDDDDDEDSKDEDEEEKEEDRNRSIIFSRKTKSIVEESEEEEEEKEKKDDDGDDDCPLQKKKQRVSLLDSDDDDTEDNVAMLDRKIMECHKRIERLKQSESTPIIDGSGVLEEDRYASTGKESVEKIDSSNGCMEDIQDDKVIKKEKFSNWKEDISITIVSDDEDDDEDDVESIEESDKDDDDNDDDDDEDEDEEEEEEEEGEAEDESMDEDYDDQHKFTIEVDVACDASDDEESEPLESHVLEEGNDYLKSTNSLSSSLGAGVDEGESTAAAPMDVDDKGCESSSSKSFTISDVKSLSVVLDDIGDNDDNNVSSDVGGTQQHAENVGNNNNDDEMPSSQISIISIHSVDDESDFDDGIGKRNRAIDYEKSTQKIETIDEEADKTDLSLHTKVDDDSGKSKSYVLSEKSICDVNDENASEIPAVEMDSSSPTDNSSLSKSSKTTLLDGSAVASKDCGISKESNVNTCESITVESDSQSSEMSISKHSKSSAVPESDQAKLSSVDVRNNDYEDSFPHKPKSVVKDGSGARFFNVRSNSGPILIDDDDDDNDDTVISSKNDLKKETQSAKTLTTDLKESSEGSLSCLITNVRTGVDDDDVEAIILSDSTPAVEVSDAVVGDGKDLTETGNVCEDGVKGFTVSEEASSIGPSISNEEALRKGENDSLNNVNNDAIDFVVKEKPVDDLMNLSNFDSVSAQSQDSNSPLSKSKDSGSPLGGKNVQSSGREEEEKSLKYNSVNEESDKIGDDREMDNDDDNNSLNNKAEHQKEKDEEKGKVVDVVVVDNDNFEESVNDDLKTDENESNKENQGEISVNNEESNSMQVDEVEELSDVKESGEILLVDSKYGDKLTGENEKSNANKSTGIEDMVEMSSSDVVSDSANQELAVGDEDEDEGDNLSSISKLCAIINQEQEEDDENGVGETEECSGSVIGPSVAAVVAGEPVKGSECDSVDENKVLEDRWNKNDEGLSVRRRNDELNEADKSKDDVERDKSQLENNESDETKNEDVWHEDVNDDESGRGRNEDGLVQNKNNEEEIEGDKEKDNAEEKDVSKKTTVDESEHAGSSKDQAGTVSDSSKEAAVDTQCENEADGDDKPECDEKVSGKESDDNIDSDNHDNADESSSRTAAGKISSIVSSKEEARDEVGKLLEEVTLLGGKKDRSISPNPKSSPSSSDKTESATVSTPKQDDDDLEIVHVDLPIQNHQPTRGRPLKSTRPYSSRPVQSGNNFNHRPLQFVRGLGPVMRGRPPKAPNRYSPYMSHIRSPKSEFGSYNNAAAMGSKGHNPNSRGAINSERGSDLQQKPPVMKFPVSTARKSSPTSAIPATNENGVNWKLIQDSIAPQLKSALGTDSKYNNNLPKPTSGLQHHPSPQSGSSLISKGIQANYFPPCGSAVTSLPVGRGRAGISPSNQGLRNQHHHSRSAITSPPGMPRQSGVVKSNNVRKVSSQSLTLGPRVPIPSIHKPNFSSTTNSSSSSSSLSTSHPPHSVKRGALSSSLSHPVRRGPPLSSSIPHSNHPIIRRGPPPSSIPHASHPVRRGGPPTFPSSSPSSRSSSHGLVIKQVQSLHTQQPQSGGKNPVYSMHNRSPYRRRMNPALCAQRIKKMDGLVMNLDDSDEECQTSSKEKTHTSSDSRNIGASRSLNLDGNKRKAGPINQSLPAKMPKITTDSAIVLSDSD